MINPHKQYHLLKIDKEFLLQIFAGRKTFEIRKNDRDFKVGDSVKFQTANMPDSLWLEYPEEYKITYMTDYEQKPGYVVFSIRRVED